MDGRSRALDNVFVERHWRTVKYEEVYLREYIDASDAQTSLKRYLRFYNQARRHQSLDRRTPAEVHFGDVAQTSQPRRLSTGMSHQ